MPFTCTPTDADIDVTFRLPGVRAERAVIVGDFNEWSVDASPMAWDGDGMFVAMRLEPGRSYRFRYLIDDDRWENDPQADDYVPNVYGGDDSVIDLREHRTAGDTGEHRTGDSTAELNRETESPA